MNKMQIAVNGASDLKTRETGIKLQIEELEAKNKGKMSREAIQQMNMATQNLH